MVYSVTYLNVNSIKLLKLFMVLRKLKTAQYFIINRYSQEPNYILPITVGFVTEKN